VRHLLWPLASALAVAALLQASAQDAELASCRAENAAWQARWQEQEAVYAEALIRHEIAFQALRDAVADAPEACLLLAGNAPGDVLADLGCPASDPDKNVRQIQQ
jgi:hypothetical protein